MPKKRKVDHEVQHVLVKMEGLNPSSAEYKKCVENLKTLFEAKKTYSFDRNQVLGLIVQVGVTVLVLHFEKTGIVTSRVSAFWRKF